MPPFPPSPPSLAAPDFMPHSRYSSCVENLTPKAPPHERTWTLPRYCNIHPTRWRTSTQENSSTRATTTPPLCVHGRLSISISCTWVNPRFIEDVRDVAKASVELPPDRLLCVGIGLLYRICASTILTWTMVELAPPRPQNKKRLYHAYVFLIPVPSFPRPLSTR